MSLKTRSCVLLSTFSIAGLMFGAISSSNAQDMHFRTKIYENSSGTIPSWHPKDPRTRVDFWFPHMRGGNSFGHGDPVYGTTPSGEKSGNFYRNQPVRSVRRARKVVYKSTPSYVVINADIENFERRRPASYRPVRNYF